jgi:hypothetical protein
MKRIVAPAGLVLILLIARPPAARGFKEGPYPNVTGGFGEQSCHLCHLDNPVNAPGGSLTLSGVPATYAAGRPYEITVTVTRAGLRRGGFEISARFAAGTQKGRQAGAWRALDARVQVIPSQADPSLTFVQHNLAGSMAPSRGANTWTIEWTAPAAAGAIQFNVAGNASNNDDSPLGDYIYLAAARSASQPPRMRKLFVAHD